MFESHLCSVCTLFHFWSSKWNTHYKKRILILYVLQTIFQNYIFIFKMNLNFSFLLISFWHLFFYCVRRRTIKLLNLLSKSSSKRGPFQAIKHNNLKRHNKVSKKKLAWKIINYHKCFKLYQSIFNVLCFCLLPDFELQEALRLSSANLQEREARLLERDVQLAEAQTKY